MHIEHVPIFATISLKQCKEVKNIPIASEWIRYTTTGLDSVPIFVIGVYEIADANENTIYIGHGYIRFKLDDHASKTRGAAYIPPAEAAFFRYELAPYPPARERELVSEFKRIHGCLPRYNDGTAK